MNLGIDVYYFILLGFAVHMAWLLGKREGISRTIDFLERTGKIDLLVRKVKIDFED